MKDSVMDMTYREFSEWAAQHCADAVMMGGFRELSRAVELVVQQQAQIFNRNKGFQKETK